jgi:hypothetical protein
MTAARVIAPSLADVTAHNALAELHAAFALGALYGTPDYASFGDAVRRDEFEQLVQTGQWFPAVEELKLLVRKLGVELPDEILRERSAANLEPGHPLPVEDRTRLRRLSETLWPSILRSVSADCPTAHHSAERHSPTEGAQPPRPVPALPELPQLDGNLHVIHCSTGLPQDFPNGTQPISVITVLAARSGVKKSFATIWLAPELGVPVADLKARHAELERELLRRFYAFVAEHPSVVWMHSNMRSSQYGFDVIERRASIHGLSPVPIPECRRFDLYRWILRQHPDPYFGHPRQDMMFRLNFGHVPDLLSEDEAASAWAANNFTALVRSAEAKVGCIDGLRDKLARGVVLKGNPRCLAGCELDRFATAVAASATANLTGDSVALRQLVEALSKHLACARAELATPHPRGTHRPAIDAVIRDAARRLEALRTDAAQLSDLDRWCRTDLVPVGEELKNDGSRQRVHTATPPEVTRKPIRVPAGRKRKPVCCKNAERDAWVARQRNKKTPTPWKEIYDDLMRIAAKRGWDVPSSAKALEEANRRRSKRLRESTSS